MNITLNPDKTIKNIIKVIQPTSCASEYSDKNLVKTVIKVIGFALKWVEYAHLKKDLIDLKPSLPNYLPNHMQS